jgi:hypothetical protein
VLAIIGPMQQCSVMQHTTQSHDINLAALTLAGDTLLPELNRLREQDPIHWSATSGVWIVTGHAEIIDGLACKVPLSNASLPDRLIPGMTVAEMQAR